MRARVYGVLCVCVCVCVVVLCVRTIYVGVVLSVSLCKYVCLRLSMHAYEDSLCIYVCLRLSM